MKSQVLKKLRESIEYLSGQDLCRELGVSRTAVWKAVHQLTEEGYQIEAVRNKGYRLLEGPDVISGDEIESLIQTSWAGRNVRYFPETDSTNIRARQLGEEGAEHGTLVTAEYQSGGKGRRGRSWTSPAAENIYMTLLLRPDIRPEKAPMLTLVMALAVAVGIMDETSLSAQIKWPNDIVITGKKVCGILTEMSTDMDDIHYVIIGVGVNANMSSLPEELSGHATSLRIETGRTIPRAKIIAAILTQFEVLYQSFMERGDLSGIRSEYNCLLVNKEQEVRVLAPGQEYPGHALGINDTGELLVRKDNGEIEAVYAGEVSVRGIYGYV